MKHNASSLRVLLITAAFLAAAVFARAAGGPPELLSYQGYLVDANGAPLGMDGSGDPLPSNYDVTFSIFSASSGGNLLWREQQTITVDAGYFSVLLGEGTQVGSDPRPPLSEVFTGIGADERFIGVAVRFEAGGAFSDILPRLRLLTSPYAFLATQARSVVNPDGNPLLTAEGGTVTISGTLTATQPIVASGASLTNLNASSLSSGTVSLARLPGLPASQITSGTFSDARLSSNIARLNASGQTFTAGLQVNSGLAINQPSFRFSTETITPGALIGFTTRYLLSENNNPGFLGGFRWKVSGETVMTSSPVGLSIAGTLTEQSDKRTKEAIVPIDVDYALLQLLELPIYEWSFSAGEGTRHVGPMAQDFFHSFGLGVNETTLSPRDLVGVSVAAIQGLHAKIEAQEAKIASLEETITALSAAVAALTTALDEGE